MPSALAEATMIQERHGGSFILDQVDPRRQPGWDSTVLSFPACTFFHSTAWGQVLSETYGYKPNYFVLRTCEQPLFLVPAMEVQSWFTGKRAVSLPFTDVCEPLGSDAAASEHLLSALIEWGIAQKWRSLHVHGKGDLLRTAPVSVRYFGHILDLSAGVDLLLARLPGSVKQCLKRAKRAGVTVRTDTSPDAMRLFYRLHCRTRRRHGVPPQPFRFFENIQRWVLDKGMGLLMLAERGQTPIAASMFFHFGRSAIFKFGASDEEHQQVRGNNAVMWEAIRWYATNNYRWLHFGRTSVFNNGLRRFKLGWGAQEIQIQYFKYDFRRRAFVTEADPTRSLVNRIFRMMPLTVNRWVGSLAYRHMAS